MAHGKVNEDLVKERKKCTFDIKELTYLIDGGEKKTQDRKEVEKVISNAKELIDPVPEEYMSHKERYENTIRKGCLVANLMMDYADKHTGIENFGPSNTFRILNGVIKDVSPFMLHMGMFIPTIMGQGSPEQQAEWLPKALGMSIIGTYAQTELGHGTFLRGLETTATYDPKTKEFILNSPTLTSYKWWPGGLAHTANHCIVVAQLYTNGECHGVHPFFVQIRDSETHMPLPGIKVGEIGPKLGFQTANNGFLGFEQFRIPRTAMLMKNAQVLENGTYMKAPNEKLAYGTMVFVRVIIVGDSAYELAKAATIAVRYSAVRHQSKIRPDEPEPQLLDYLTQQHKLFIAVATSHALRFTGRWLWNAYTDVVAAMKAGNLEQLPEMHALACCLKAVASRDAATCVEQCRLACGGQGYMTSSNLPIIYGIVTAANTYEGENTVLLLQTARYLVKAWQQASIGQPLTPTVLYLANHVNNNNHKWQNTPEGIITGLQAVAAGRIKSSSILLQKHIDAKAVYEDAWNLASVQLVAAAEAHCRAVLCEVFYKEVRRVSSTSSPPLAQVLNQLAELYLVYWTLENTGDLLLYSTLSKDDIIYLRERYEQLLALIRPNIVGLVDAYDIHDRTLNSTLGSYDGRVYERLMEEALKSPLNKEPVNQSFHKYLKPFMQGKL